MTGAQKRRLILHMGVSLDGFVGARDGSIDWLEPAGEPYATSGAARHRDNLEMLAQVDLIVLGRGAHDQMAPAWSGSDSPMARLMNSLPKLVFTSSEPEFEWANSRVSAGPLEEEIAALKAEDGRDLICIGGAAMARSLTRLGLVDEYRVTVHPVVLGDGKKFWPELPGARRLPTIGTTAFADGSVVHQLAGVGHLSSAG